ncbi:MAG: gdhB [Sediminibacterium sp.]|nr:gdhB [Sediminibacterium sp.]
MPLVKFMKAIAYTALILFIFTFCRSKAPVFAGTAPDVKEPGIRIQTIVNNYEIIWGMDFLPDGDLLFTEKKGKLHRYHAGTVTDITGMPEVNTNGQGGLLDLKVHPAYASNGWIYCTYAAYDNNKYGLLTLARFKLKGNTVTGMETLLRTSTPDLWSGHYGSRITFDKQGMLYLSIGEGGPTSYGGPKSPNMNAQNVKSEWGKVHRMTDAGKVPADNPILPGNSAPTTVYSYGHRNPQGLAYNPLTNEVWENEHGPRGGDEVNIIKKGKNYGWPLVSFGINYDGKPVTDNPQMNGVEPPIHTWTPSIAPCGLAFITTDKFKGWKGNMLVGSLSFTHLTRCEFSNGKLVKETKMLNGVGRVRNVKQGPDGNIYVSVEGPGRILQLSPE